MDFERQFDDERAEPGMVALSPAWLYRLIPVPKTKTSNTRTMFLTLRDKDKSLSKEDEIKRGLFVADWNLLWESRWARNFVLEFPQDLKWLKRISRHRVELLSCRNGSLEHHYLALYHLLPFQIREKFGLPHLRWGKWPLLVPDSLNLDRKLVCLTRLKKAFADYIWPFLFMDRKPKTHSSYSNQFPLIVLAESLDFWADHLHLVIEDIWGKFPRVAFDDPAQIQDAKNYVDPRITIERPRVGGHLWAGEETAREVTKQLVVAADKSYNLRQTIDLVLSNRISDDFSDRWSREKEDFERTFYHKRSKAKVYFREIPDPILSFNPESAIEANDIINKLMMILSPKERSIVVCLRTGISSQTEIAKHLGYKNHSSVSRLMKRIAKKAKYFLDNS